MKGRVHSFRETCSFCYAEAWLNYTIADKILQDKFGGML